MTNISQIALSQGKFAIVDAGDYDWLMQHKWSYHHTGYAVSWLSLDIYVNGIKQRKQIRMHSVLMKAKQGQKIDHKDGDTLNNRRNNLRIATTSQNGMNRKKSKNCTSQYKGVCWNKSLNKWLSQIKLNSKIIYLGYFDSEIDAAASYNEAAVKYYGEFAALNAWKSYGD